MSPDAPFVEPALLHWKYYAPRPDSPGSRSYVLRRNGEIVAHLGVVPVPDPELGIGLALIDWAARRDLPGVGITLLRKVAGLSPFLLVVAGSPATQAVLPKLGFSTADRLHSHARIVRPLRQAIRDPRNGWKKWARFLRNASALARSQTRMKTDQSDGAKQSREQRERSNLRAERVESFEDGLLDYYLLCPGASVSGYQLLRDGYPAGRFLLSRVEGQARIAHLEADSRDLAAAYRGAADQAALDPETSEVMAVAGTPALAGALHQAGLSAVSSDPVFFYPAGRAVARDWSLLHGDGAYLHVPSNPYLL